MMGSFASIFDPETKTIRFPMGEDGDTIVVGNAERTDRCEARIELPRWGMAPLIWTFDHASTLPTFADDVLTIPGVEKSIRIYQDVSGHCEFQIVCHTRPASSFQFGIESYADLKFCPQPALTLDEIAEGHVRPDDIVDSVAVYHASRTGNRFKAGKWGHFHRAWAEDRNGSRVWGQTTFSGGTLTVEFDSLWIANAPLPITIGPDLGYTSVGGSYYNTAARFWITNWSVTAGSDGTASKLWIYTHTDSDRVKLGLYDGTAGGNLLSQGELTSPVPTGQWNSVDISGDAVAVSNGNDYLTAAMWEASGHGGKYDTGGASGISRYNTSPTAYASQMVDPSEDDNDWTAYMSLYMEYAVAAAGITVNRTIKVAFA